MRAFKSSGLLSEGRPERTAKPQAAFLKQEWNRVCRQDTPKTTAVNRTGMAPRRAPLFPIAPSWRRGCSTLTGRANDQKSIP